jgi:hypothetical protein
MPVYQGEVNPDLRDQKAGTVLMDYPVNPDVRAILDQKGYQAFLA